MSPFQSLFCILLLQTISLAYSYRATCPTNGELTFNLERRFHLKIKKANIDIDFGDDSYHVSVWGDFLILIKPERLRTRANFTTNPTRCVKKVHEGETLNNCVIDNFDLSLDAPEEIKQAIVELTKDCISFYTCKQCNSRYPAGQRLRSMNNGNLQNQINAMADSSVATLISRNASSDGNIYYVPNIKSKFSTGDSFWKVDAKIQVQSGMIKGLKGLKRTADVIVKNQKAAKKMTLVLKYKWTNPRLSYESYKLKYGLFNVEGDVSSAASSVVVKLGITFHFNEASCTSSLTEFHLNLGKYDLNISGFGVFDGVVSSIVSGALVNQFEVIAQQLIAAEVSTIDCEQYRKLHYEL